MGTLNNIKQNNGVFFPYVAVSHENFKILKPYG